MISRVEFLSKTRITTSQIIDQKNDGFSLFYQVINEFFIAD